MADGLDQEAWQQQVADKLRTLAGMLEQTAPMLTALGDPVRQHILMALLNGHGGLRVGELAKEIGLSRPTVSHHLRIMREAGLVERYSVGTKNFYYPNPSQEVWGGLAHMTSSAERLVRLLAAYDAEHGQSCPRRTE